MSFDKTGTPSANWTRRQFVRASAGVAASASMHRVFASQGAGEIAGYAYATHHANGERGRIHGYAIRGERWTRIETLPSDAPSFTCISADGRTLYVANEIAEVGGLPRGGVTTYRIDADGRLHLLGVKALSLSAVRPGHLAISPDGKTLAVAASGGGAYNTVSIREDGSLGGITAIRKETGCGPHETQTAAHPHTLLFDNRSGSLLTSDDGSDRVSFFELGRERLIRRHTLEMGAGSGPGSLALGTNALYVRNTLSGSLNVYRYDSVRGVGQKLQSLACDEGHSIALHTSGRTLYSGGKDLRAWRVNGDGTLAPSKTMKAISADRLVPAFEGRVLFAMDRRRGIIRQLALHAQTGEPTQLQDVVQADVAWTSLSVLTA